MSPQGSPTEVQPAALPQTTTAVAEHVVVERAAAEPTAAKAADETTSAEPADDVDRVTEAVLTASRLLVSVSARSLSEVQDSLTLPQFRTLVILASRGPLRLTHLAERLAVNPSTAMRMAERLNTARMINRAPNPENRRESILTLTDAGRRVVIQVTSRRREEIAAIVQRMPPTHRDQLVEALEAFSAAGGELPAKHDPIPLGWQ